MTNSLPNPIKHAIESGDAILFLGSGACFNALVNGIQTRIHGEALKNKLSDTFLEGKHKDKSLMTVADLARSDASLVKVQSFIRETFINLRPAPFHLKIAKFRWRAIVTTNYDLVIERAYEECDKPLQKLMPVTKDGDELEAALSEQNSVPYLKLHGCITNYADIKVPLVLDSNEYSKFKKGREHLVKTFTEWATQHPIIFCGYSLNDENIKDILFDIGDTSQQRDSYLYVDLEFDSILTRFWQSRRITPFASNFENFLTRLEEEIPLAQRMLAQHFTRNSLSIAKFIPSHDNPSNSLLQYLTEELFHVEVDMPAMSAVDPKGFYSGLDVSFNPIYNNLDIHRQLLSQLLNTAVMDTLKSDQPKLFLIKGYAGCGKSVFLKRLALETSRLLDQPLTVFLKEGAILRSNLILELQQLVNSRIYLFVDDSIEFQDEIDILLERAKIENVPITIIATARTNELSIYGKSLLKNITKDFELFDLESGEVGPLLEKLSKFKILGPLEQYTDDEKQVFIAKFYGQQLLVALHEITFGDSFESILTTEFEKIIPREAQQLYLDICTLHQSGVGVRAGLISRISGFKITVLNDFLNGPLARVVRINYDAKYRDYVYKSRHQEISKMIFSLSISDPDARAYQLIRILNKIDLDYSSDRKAFFELVKGKRLAELFERKDLALLVFDAAEKATPPTSYLYHQKAILELNHVNGNDETANELLRLAEIAIQEEGYKDASIQHTKANLLRKRALSATSPIERERYRADARSILKPQVSKNDSSYPEHLLGLVLMDELRDYFDHKKEQSEKEHKNLGEESIIRITSELSKLIDEQLLKSPNDAPMTKLRSDFLKVIGKQPLAILVLESFHKKNPSNSAITRIYAEALYSNDKKDVAMDVIRTAVLASPNDKLASLSLAKMLIKTDEFANSATILSFLRRSFSDGDSHYEARFLFARCNLLYGDLARGKNEFIQLQRVYLPLRDNQFFPVLNSDGSELRYSGKILSKQAGFGFIASSELRFNVFFKQDGIKSTEWQLMKVGHAVEYTLGFTFRGSIAINIKLKSGTQLNIVN
ncbi:MAG: SIR2 family protein [Pseudomonadota bacterium]